MVLGRRSPQPDLTAEPPAKMLRKSRSLRLAVEEVLMEGRLENHVEIESAPTQRSEIPQHEQEDGSDGGAAVAIRDALGYPRIHRDVLDYRQRMLYATNFKLHFGVSEEMLGFLEDFCRVMAPNCPIDSISNGIVKLTRDAREEYGLLKSFYCTSCDNRLANSKAFCQTEGCEMLGVAPKRSRSSKRASIFTVRIEPQLTSILQRTLQLLVELHTTIHSPDGSDVNPVLSETSSFPQYHQEIESFSRFRNSEITVVLTMSVDGVRFKKLSRSEAWPIYIRLEGLPSKEKNKFENIMLAGILFARKTPTERLFSELFSRLKHELTALEAGIPIQLVTPASTWTWICTPKLTHGIIDFAALKALYNLPRWQSIQGCHLCVFPGQRVGRRIIWFNRFPTEADRRTDESLIFDAESRTNGVTGRTQMADFFTVNHCMPDALHLLSEGITMNVFKAMLGPKSHVSAMTVRRECIPTLHSALQNTRNYTYSTKFVLDLDDLSSCTGSEKDALSFVVFPLAAALDMFSDHVGAVGVLAYWILVRVFEKPELTALDFRGCRDLANSMKLLWYEIEPALITLKVHCFIDHAILEDLPHIGTPYNWSSSSFESVHRRLQLRVAQCTTNFEEKIINDFLLHKDVIEKLENEVELIENLYFDRLSKKVLQGRKSRDEFVAGNHYLEIGWYVPERSVLPFQDLRPEHQVFLTSQRELAQEFSSRLCHGDQAYSSAYYWRRRMDTIQSCVYMEDEDGEPRYGNVVAFGFCRWTHQCCVLLEELITKNPFLQLAEALVDSPHPSSIRARSALRKISDNNRFFMSVVSQKLGVFNAYEIKSSAILIQGPDFCFVSRV